MRIRLPAEWMQAADDRILEYLAEETVGGPKSISDDERIDLHRKTVSRRLRLLTNIGMTKRVQRGVYQITEFGMEYLKGDADLRDEPKPE